MITNERKIELMDTLLNDKVECDGLEGTIYYLIESGFELEEILALNFDPELTTDIWNETIRYVVCGLAYDENYNILDNEWDWGTFTNETSAAHAYEAIVSKYLRNPSLLTTDTSIAYVKIQMEKCVENDEEIFCLEVRNEYDINLF